MARNNFMRKLSLLILGLFLTSAMTSSRVMAAEGEGASGNVGRLKNLWQEKNEKELVDKKLHKGGEASQETVRKVPRTGVFTPVIKPLASKPLVGVAGRMQQNALGVLQKIAADPDAYGIEVNEGSRAFVEDMKDVKLGDIRPLVGAHGVPSGKSTINFTVMGKYFVQFYKADPNGKKQVTQRMDAERFVEDRLKGKESLNNFVMALFPLFSFKKDEKMIYDKSSGMEVLAYGGGVFPPSGISFEALEMIGEGYNDHILGKLGEAVGQLFADSYDENNKTVLLEPDFNAANILYNNEKDKFLFIDFGSIADFSVDDAKVLVQTLLNIALGGGIDHSGSLQASFWDGFKSKFPG